MSDSESEKVYEPIPPPTVCESDPHANISDVERAMYGDVLKHFSDSEYQIPGIEGNGGLTEAEQFWLSFECLLRYLRAVKWKSATAAITRLESTLKWRREYGIDDIVSASHVEPEAVTGKQVLFGYDTRGRPALYLFPSRQNTDEPTRQIQMTVWMLERTIDLMGPGIETLALLINYGDKAKNPSLGVARTVLNILQDHYPERLGAALILNVPFLLNAFYKLINPFIDPVSRAKMKFNPEPVKDGLFTGDMLMSEWWGGDRNFEYVHEKYWPSLVGSCEARRSGWLEKWRALGGKIGLKEWEYKDIDTPQVVGTKAADTKAVVESGAEKVAATLTTEATVPTLAAT